MKFSPDMDPKEVEKFRAKHKKDEQDVMDFFTILMSDPSDDSLEKAKKAVYGEGE
jgi:hypothetical protein